MSSSVPGTNVAPVSFPGIASGIDYNSIITKLTSLTLSQNVSLNAQIATLNAANTELIKINNLVNQVQSSLGGLSDPSIFNAYSATSSNTAEGNASVLSGSTPLAGTYTITNSVQATATTVTNNSAAGHSITDGGSDNLILTKSFAAVTPSNGTSASGNGSVTVNGVTITYNVNVDSVQSVLSKIQSQVRAATGDASFIAALNPANGEVTISSANKPITLGAATDSGNILQVFKLTTAQVNNTGSSGTVTSTSDIGGINQAAAFNNTTSAGYKTAVTSGTFTINGVVFTISNAGDNTASVLARINASNAGVVASYDATTNKITLSAVATGPQSIVLGAAGDSSNFLTSAGLTLAAGGTTQVGSQASVSVTNPGGATTTVYSNSNQVTTAIPGVQLNLQTFTGPYSITVGADSSKLVSALNTFVSAYNTALTEINNATIPPAVISSQPGSTTAPTSASIGGGVLWNNSDIGNVKNQLVNLVSGFFGNSTGSYNSLSSIGLNLTSSFQILSTASNGGAAANQSQPVTTQTLQGTDGTFQAIDTTKLAAALKANASQVQQLFTGSTGLSNVLGNYLGFVTGLPTLLTNGIVGQLPAGGIAILAGFENTNTDSITTIAERVKQITDTANSQADSLRVQFTATEAQIAQFQALQQQLSGFFKSAGG